MVKYINLHAHSEFSLLDGVGDVKKHFKKTIESGHSGCCITDHGSYASAYYLDTIFKNQTKDKDIKLVNGLHKVVRGSEIYIYYDLDQKELLRLADEGDPEQVLELLNRISMGHRYSSLFSKNKTLINVDNTESVEQDLMGNKSVKEKIGNDLINAIEELGINNDTYKLITDFAAKMVRCRSNKYGHLTLLVQNLAGHHNMCRIISESHEPGNFYTRPRFPLSKLKEYSDGLLATTGCFIGIIPSAIFNNSGKEKELLEYFLNIFGNRMFIEIHLADVSYKFENGQHYKYSEENPQQIINKRMMELAEEYSMMDRIYIAQDSHMPNKEDKIIQDLIIKSDGTNKNGWHFKDSYYIKNVEEMWADYKKIMNNEDRVLFEKLCNNTMNALAIIDDFLIPTSDHLVDFDYKKHWTNDPRVPKNMSDDLESIVSLYRGDFTEVNAELTLKNEQDNLKAEVIIEQLLSNSAAKSNYEYQKVMKEVSRSYAVKTLLKTIIRNNKFDILDPKYHLRLMFEIETIVLNGYCDFQNYFMTIEMFSRVLYLSGEIRGPGRGSAAGSLLAFGLDITDIDPIVENLSFGRFMSKERVGGFDCQFAGGNIPLADYMKANINNVSVLEYQDNLIALNSTMNLDKIEFDWLYHNPIIIKYVMEQEDGAFESSGLKFAQHLNKSLSVTNMKTIAGSRPDIDYDSSNRELLCRFLTLLFGKKHVALVGTYGSLKIKGAIKMIYSVKFNELSLSINNLQKQNKELKHIKESISDASMTAENIDRLSKLTGTNVTENELEFYYKSGIDSEIFQRDEAIIKLTTEVQLYSPERSNIVTKMFDKVKLSEEELALEENTVLGLYIERNDEIKKFFETSPIATLLTTVTSSKTHYGIHAGGVLLSKEPITDWMPCFYSDDKEMYVTQLDKYMVENYGFDKMDILGLITLEEIRETLKLVKANHGVDLRSRLRELATTENEEVNKAFLDLNLDRIFQFGTAAPIQFIRKISSFKRNYGPMITSLLRPGPMGSGFHTSAVKRINGENYEKSHPIIEDVLSRTHGLIVYQEQVMALAQKVGGFNEYESDVIRRGMGKKDFAKLEKFKVRFIENGGELIGKDEAKLLWDQLAKFAEYGFNESHAVAYASLSYAQMWLKLNYFQEWLTPVLSSLAKKNGQKEKSLLNALLIKNARLIRPININKSSNMFTLADGFIYKPLIQIKGISESSLNLLMENRPFMTYMDFINYHMKSKQLNKTQLKNLVKTGCLDSLEGKEELGDLIDQYRKTITVSKEDVINNVLEFRRFLIFLFTVKICNQKTNNINEEFAFGNKKVAADYEEFLEINHMSLSRDFVTLNGSIDSKIEDAYPNWKRDNGYKGVAELSEELAEAERMLDVLNSEIMSIQSVHGETLNQKCQRIVFLSKTLLDNYNAVSLLTDLVSDNINNAELVGYILDSIAIFYSDLYSKKAFIFSLQSFLTSDAKRLLGRISKGKVSLDNKISLNLKEITLLRMICNIINYGTLAISFYKKAPDHLMLNRAIAIIQDLHIRKENVDFWKKHMRVFSVGDIMSNTLYPVDDDLHMAAEVSDLLSREHNIYGMVLMPEIKKDFDREFIRNGQVKYMINFRILDGSIVNVTIFDADTMMVSETENIRSHLKNSKEKYNLIMIKGKFTCGSRLDRFNFVASRGSNSVIIM